MGVSYKRLWKILIDRDMKKKDLMNIVGLSPSTISKLSGNEFVSMQVIVMERWITNLQRMQRETK